jgi:glycine/D-amino acid oxidase-like deaminating enzyme
MLRSAHGYWLADAGPVSPQPALAAGPHTADVLVIGGGYLGMWTAWRLAERGADVLLVEADRCGHGPSGRNGGFVNPLWDRAAELREMFGDDAARRLCEVSANAADLIETWCSDQGVDAHLRRAPMLEVAATAGQVGDWDEGIAACRALGAGDEAAVLDARGARAVCDSPEFHGGVLWTTAATIHPAQLALGLRQRLIEHPGVRVHEYTRVVTMTDGLGAVDVRSNAGATVSARSAVLAINHRSAAVGPLRGALSVASSHAVATEPVPDVLDRLGWVGGEPIADCRTMLHYFRTTRDDRIVFGWGGGRMAYGGRHRTALDNDSEVQDQTVRHLHELLPQLIGKRITHAWGGPIDVSPVHLPWFGTLRSVHYGVGFTGNGVGPTVWGGQVLADLVSGATSELTSLPNVGGLPPKRFPPEPMRYVGGAVIRQALMRVDDADQRGTRADPISRAVGALPGILGLRLPR